MPYFVSTHSRPKAAGSDKVKDDWLDNLFQHTAARRRLGIITCFSQSLSFCFNTQPPEGGWRQLEGQHPSGLEVSTHSRPKAAGCASICHPLLQFCFNTQPPEGGWQQAKIKRKLADVSTHSRPKAAGSEATSFTPSSGVSTHSRPKAAGVLGAS